MLVSRVRMAKAWGQVMTHELGAVAPTGPQTSVATCSIVRSGQTIQLFIYSFARWRFQRNFVSKGCNFVNLGQITEKSNRRRTETILHSTEWSEVKPLNGSSPICRGSRTALYMAKNIISYSSDLFRIAGFIPGSAAVYLVYRRHSWQFQYDCACFQRREVSADS